MIYKVTFTEDQMDRIINLDEKKLSCDSNDAGRGGSVTEVYIVKGVPRTGTATSKSYVSTTFIMITTPKGSRGIPVHMEFS